MYRCDLLLAEIHLKSGLKLLQSSLDVLLFLLTVGQVGEEIPHIFRSDCLLLAEVVSQKGGQPRVRDI